MRISIPKETTPGERRVAMVPDLVPKLTNAGFEVWVESGAGADVGFVDRQYLEQGARVVSEVLSGTDIVLKVRPPSQAEIAKLSVGATMIGLMEPYSGSGHIEQLAAQKVTVFAMELMPRIARARPGYFNGKDNPTAR